MQHTTEAPKQYQCRHIFTDGRRCASPCLRQEEFCYYHHTTRRPVANPSRRRSRSSTFHLPLPEDRSAIQASIGEVLQRIAANEIDPRRAGLLLYGLQIASLNLPKTQPTHRNAKPEPIEVVDEITTDPELGTLAPRAEVGKATQRKSPVTLLIESMLQSDKEEEETANPGINEVAATPVTIPTLQATADSTISSFERVEDRPVVRARLKGRGFSRAVCPPNPTRLQPLREFFDRPSQHLPLPVLPNATPNTFISTLSEVERARAHLPLQWRNPLLHLSSHTATSRTPLTTQSSLLS